MRATPCYLVPSGEEVAHALIDATEDDEVVGIRDDVCMECLPAPGQPPGTGSCGCWRAVGSRRHPAACRACWAATLAPDGSPPINRTHLSDVPCPLPRRIERVRVSIASPLTRPSPNGRRVGFRIGSFEACSGFTHVTARRIAQPPKATFAPALPVPAELLVSYQINRQLPGWNPPPPVIRAFGAHCH